MASHNTQAGIKAVQTSQASVNYVNNVVTGRAPNTYSPYDSHGNVYSYYNSSYDTGKIPSPDAPTIKDIDADSVYYCDRDKKNISGFSVFTQNAADKLKMENINGLGVDSNGNIIRGQGVSDSDVEALRVIAELEQNGASEEVVLRYVSNYVNSHPDTYIVKGKTLSYYSNMEDITTKLIRVMVASEDMYATFYLNGEVYPADQIPFAWIGGLKEFKENVQNRGIWDLKQQDEWSQSSLYMFNGEIVDKDAPGNILYGYMGKAYGIPDIVLYGAAGYAQVSAGTSSFSFADSFFDDPMDQENIRRGIELYEQAHIREGR